MANVTAVVLAAGNGKRMQSELLKVLHAVGGKPMVGHVVDNALTAGISDVIAVIGVQRERVQAYLGDRVRYAVQEEQLGTAHAVMQALPALTPETEHVVVLYGDNPLISAATIKRLVGYHVASDNPATLLTAVMNDPAMLGRIIRRPDGSLADIVEYKDATLEQRQINEIWPGILVFKAKGLPELLARLDNNNAQGEYYLPKAVQLLLADGYRVEVGMVVDEEEAIGPNDRVQLAEAEAAMRRRVLTKLMLSGVTIIDPASTYIDSTVQVGRDTTIYPGTHLEGATQIGSGCVIGPMTRIVESQVADGSRVEMSVVEESYVGPGCKVGPYSHIRPGCRLEADVELGNYAEIKKSTLARGVKMHHHSYLGDSEVGDNVNVGAGVITSNYDGFNKHKTVIKARAFLGTNVNIIAPRTIGEGALLAAGSTIDKDVPDDALAVARARQETREGYATRLRARFAAQKAAKQEAAGRDKQ